MRRWRRPSPWLRPPRARAARTNLALVPASLLPSKPVWQRLANQLPPGNLLIVGSPRSDRQRHTMATLAKLFAAKGTRVTTIPAEHVLAAR